MSRTRSTGLVDRVVDRVIDGGRLPDPVLRAAIRGLLRRRLAREGAGGPAAVDARKQALLDAWWTGRTCWSSAAGGAA